MKKKTILTVPHKILQDQSQKLRQKLDNLKHQIEEKKREKAQSKNNKLATQSLKQSRNSLSNSRKDNGQLITLLTELKMETLLGKFNEKGIKQISQFQGITADEVDKWRDIPVGYRIKIKKYLNNKNKNSIGSSPIKPVSLEKEKEIEEIVKNRNISKKYVKLNKNEQYQFNQAEQLGQQQQQIMIQSLLDAFNPNFSSNNDKEDQANYRPRTAIKLQSEKAWVQTKQYSNYSYCWCCLKMLMNQKIKFQNRQFCSEECKQKYKLTTKVEEDGMFFQQLSNLQNKFNQHLKRRGQKPKINNGINQQKQDEQISEIDFQIM